MPAPLTPAAAAARRDRVLEAARWCFLTFGYEKTTLEDISHRAKISRTLLYRSYRDKEAIFSAVFDDWLIARRPRVVEAAQTTGPAAQRLLNVCRIMVLEPWADLICTPMGHQFLAACERVAPEVSAAHDEIIFEASLSILGDRRSAEVFLLALDGLASDQPDVETLDGRLTLLIDRFTRNLDHTGQTS